MGNNLLGAVNLAIHYEIGGNYIYWSRKVNFGKLIVIDERWTKKLSLTFWSNKLKLPQKIWTFYHQKAVHFVIIMLKLPKAWQRIHEQGYGDSSVILQTKSILWSENLLQAFDVFFLLPVVSIQLIWFSNHHLFSKHTRT